jgi:uncharacterized membrane protein
MGRGRPAAARRVERMSADRGAELAERSRDTERVIFFSDGVFAIAITLLVLSIEVPDSPDNLLGQLLDEWSRFFSYVISFLVIGLFWVLHHRMFGQVRRHDPALIWLNLFLLMLVAFLPFPSALLGRYGDEPVAVVLYAASMAATSLMLSATYTYLYLHQDLLFRPATRAELRVAVLRGLMTPAVFLVSIPVALVSPTVAMYVWWLILPLRLLTGRLERAGSR